MAELGNVVGKNNMLIFLSFALQQLQVVSNQNMEYYEFV